VYYKPATESALNLELMDLMDKIYIDCPFYGSRRMLIGVSKSGYDVNRKRIQRLMRVMGLEAIYPKPRTTIMCPQNKKYPYLLRGMVIDQPNQVWAADIRYVRAMGGFFYLVALIDWYSRYVLSWQLSNTLESSFCVHALHEALERYGQPEIFNTDQGVQFTDRDFTAVLEERQIRISMDGRGRALDNVFIERLWRSFKYEDMYLKEYRDGRHASSCISNYMTFFNERRPHQGLDYRTPAEVYAGSV
jgi:putative transposase